MSEKKYNCIWGILMMVILLAAAVVCIVLPDRTYSAQEKRNLSQLPEASVDRVADGTFMSDMEGYLADQFPLRDRMVSWKALLDRGLGHIESNQVYYCADGYLMECFTEKSAQNTQDTIDAINQLAQVDESVSVTMLLVPNAISVYEEKLPAEISVADQNEYIDRFYAGLSENVTTVDVREKFASHKDTLQLYYRTDHHWTTDAAYLAYEELIEPMGLTEGTYRSGIVCDTFHGSLSAKSGYRPRTADSICVYLKEETQLYTFTEGTNVRASLYDMDRLEGGDAYEVFLGGNYAEATIRTTADTTRKLIIIKDSYANCLIPFLLDSYKEIKIIDPRYYANDLTALVGNGMYTDLLILYNVNTLSADNSLKNLVQKD